MHGGLDHLHHFISHHGRGITSRTESEDNDIPRDGLIQIDDLCWSCELLDDLLKGRSCHALVQDFFSGSNRSVKAERSELGVCIMELLRRNLQDLVCVHCLVGGGRHCIPLACQPICALGVVHHVLLYIPDDRQGKAFLLAQRLPGGIVVGHPIGILAREPVLPMLPHELVHDDVVQLLLLASLGQREAIPAGNVGFNANLVFKNLLGQEDEVRISESECGSDISLRDMGPRKPRN
jgi:hypothetical protein